MFCSTFHTERIAGDASGDFRLQRFISMDDDDNEQFALHSLDGVRVWRPLLITERTQVREKKAHLSNRDVRLRITA